MVGSPPFLRLIHKFESSPAWDTAPARAGVGTGRGNGSNSRYHFSVGPCRSIAGGQLLDVGPSGGVRDRRRPVRTDGRGGPDSVGCGTCAPRFGQAAPKDLALVRRRFLRCRRDCGAVDGGKAMTRCRRIPQLSLYMKQRHHRSTAPLVIVIQSVNFGFLGRSPTWTLFCRPKPRTFG